MIEYEEDWLYWTLLRLHGGVYIRAFYFAIPGSLVTLGLVYARELEEIDRFVGLYQLDNSVVWSALTAVLLTMVAFRTRMGYSRFWEGTGLLHQMKGEWFDTISNCVTFSIRARRTKPDEVNRFRHTLVRLMSLCHASALEEISEMEDGLDTIDPRGLDRRTLEFLSNCVEGLGFNKVEVLLHLIQSVITHAHEEGVLNVPPPILSRVYQTASRGYVNLLNSKKITDTKFPFPFVQLINALLLMHLLLTPMCLSSIVDHKVLSPLLSFITLFGMFALNLVAIELENPFGEDDNDLPLLHFQDEMNKCLLMLLHDETDLIATTSSSCNMNFRGLYRSVIGEEPPMMMTTESSVLSRPRRVGKKRSTRRFSDGDMNVETTVGCESQRHSLFSDVPEEQEGECDPDGKASPPSVKPMGPQGPSCSVPIGPTVSRTRSGMSGRFSNVLADLDRSEREAQASVRKLPSEKFPERPLETMKVASDPMLLISPGPNKGGAAKLHVGHSSTSLGLQVPNLSSDFVKGISALHESLRRWSVVMEDEAQELMRKAEVLDRMGTSAVTKLEQLVENDTSIVDLSRKAPLRIRSDLSQALSGLSSSMQSGYSSELEPVSERVTREESAARHPSART